VWALSPMTPRSIPDTWHNGRTDDTPPARPRLFVLRSPGPRRPNGVGTSWAWTVAGLGADRLRMAAVGTLIHP
jgi:hypothetical protein